MIADTAAACSEAAAALLIDIDIRDETWQDTLGDAEAVCRRTLAAAWAGAGIGTRTHEVSVVLADDAMQRTLNKTYRGKDASTNVLSFPADEDDGMDLPADIPVPLGDIVVAYETVLRECAEQGVSFHDHVAHLLVHGMLHLVGYDHETDADAQCMESLEVEILAGLEIENPYTDDTAPIKIDGKRR